MSDDRPGDHGGRRGSRRDTNVPTGGDRPDGPPEEEPENAHPEDDLPDKPSRDDLPDDREEDDLSAIPPEDDRPEEPAAPGPTNDTPVNDPVRETFAGEVDLYDVATWEQRTLLDRFVVSLVDAVVEKRRRLLFSLAAGLLLTQLVFVGLFIVRAPILGVLSLLSVVPALFLVVLFWTSDPTEREPIALVAVTFVLGVLFASFAAVTNSALLPAFELLGVVGLPLFFYLVVGPVEEFVKLLAIRVRAYRSDEFKTVVDGAVYGAVAGLGFAAIENLLYITAGAVSATPAEAVIEQQQAVAVAFTRSFVGPGHVIFSAWAGFYLGLAKFNPEHRLPIVLKGLVIASFIHATYNTAVTLLPLTAAGFVGFVLIYHTFWFGLLARKISRYRELYDAATAPRTPARREQADER